MEARAKAKREGWLSWIRQGPGEEADERAMLAGYTFSQRRADHPAEFVDDYVTLTEGEFNGHPMRLTDWQAEGIGRFFGWIGWNPEWRLWCRRFKYWYCEVPKKNGKTPFASAIGQYLLFADKPSRQVNIYNAATTRKQADRLLIHAVRSIRNNDELAAVSEIRKLEGFHSVQYKANEWNVVAADPDSADGVNGYCLADEIHRWKGFAFFNALRWMLASHPEGVFSAITTAGNNMEGVCRSLHDKTEAVNSGRQVDHQHYGEIFAAGKDDDPHDERTWHKANPSLGKDRESPLKLSSFRADYEAAKNDPTQWRDWLQLRLNLWQTSESSWIGETCPRGLYDWDSGPTERSKSKKRIDCYEKFTLQDMAGKDCYIGFDGAAVRDTTAMVLAFPGVEEPDDVFLWPIYWLPEAEAERQSARVPYQRWSEAGHIRLTPGDVIDFRTVLNDACEALDAIKPRRLYYDPLFQAEWLMQEIEAATGVERVEFRQTIITYSPPTKAFERAVITHKIRHAGNPLFTWQVGNAKAYTDANQNRRIVKQKQGDIRTVDGVQASIMAIRDTLAIESERDYYEENDVEEI